MFIGRNLNKQELIDGVNACRVDDKPLRFKVGDPVLANVNSSEIYDDETGDKKVDGETFTPGHILMQWDEGNPYRIMLDIGDGKQVTMVYCPMDVDDYVKPNPDGKQMELSRVNEVLRSYGLVETESSKKRKLSDIDDSDGDNPTQSPSKKRKVDSSPGNE